MSCSHGIWGGDSPYSLSLPDLCSESCGPLQRYKSLKRLISKTPFKLQEFFLCPLSSVWAMTGPIDQHPGAMVSVHLNCFRIIVEAGYGTAGQNLSLEFLTK